MIYQQYHSTFLKRHFSVNIYYYNNIVSENKKKTKAPPWWIPCAMLDFEFNHFSGRNFATKTLSTMYEGKRCPMWLETYAKGHRSIIRVGGIDTYYCLCRVVVGRVHVLQAWSTLWSSRKSEINNIFRPPHLNKPTRRSTAPYRQRLQYIPGDRIPLRQRSRHIYI